MNGNWQNMMEALFDSRSWQQLETESLKRMTLEYPYFPISQFMYAKKLKLEHHSAYSAQAAKTALFFNNPYWLNWQLNENAESPAHSKSFQSETSESDVAIQHHQPPPIEQEESSAETGIESEPISQEHFEDVWEKPEEQVQEPQDEVIELNNAFQIGDEPTPEPQDEVTELDNAFKLVDEPATAESIAEEPVEATIVQDEVTTFDNAFKAGDEPAVAEPIAEEPVASSIVEDVHEEVASNEVTTSEGTPVQPETRPVLEPLASGEPLIPIEPLFATDYFASQGIKLTEVEESGDKLGKKLKSFTEWLKMMKRNRPLESELSAGNVQDQKIQQIAETSNENRDVLTETMAEVLLLQGLKEKAIEVYHKLSLLNPQKSAYFAAKIEEIKVN